MNRVQVGGAMPTWGRSGAPSVTNSNLTLSPELHASSWRAFGQCCNNKVEELYKSNASSDLHVSDFTIQSTLLANVCCESWSLHNLAKHVAKSALLRAKPGNLTRKLILLHQILYHSTRCYNLKQPRTLAHMSSAESRETTLAASGGVVMRGSARMYALAPRYLRMRKHSALYLACSAYVQI